MNKLTIIAFGIILSLFVLGKVAYADFDIHGFNYPNGSTQTRNINTGDATSVQNTTNQINTVYNCNCATPSVAPTQPAVTPTPTNTQGNPGSGGGNGGSSGGSSSSSSSPTQAVLGLSNTASSNTLLRELALLLVSGFSIVAGLKLIKDNASKS